MVDQMNHNGRPDVPPSLLSPPPERSALHIFLHLAPKDVADRQRCPLGSPNLQPTASSEKLGDVLLKGLTHLLGVDYQ